jgi:hypothetical protein
MSAQHLPGITDVVSGNSTVSFRQRGKLRTVHGFSAKPGYDLASGIGTVDAPRFVAELARAAGPAARAHSRYPAADPAHRGVSARPRG